METPVWQVIVAVVAYATSLFFVHEFFRKYLKLSTAFFALTLLTFPLWKDNLGNWFYWAKTLLMIVPVLVVCLIRLSYATSSATLSFLKTRKSFWIVPVVVWLNILVALPIDIEIGNYFNAVAGVVLAATIPFPNRRWRIDTTQYKKHDLLVDIPLFWSLLYITWNANLIYGNFPGALGRTACLLLVTIIPALVYRRNHLWLSTRAYTLAFYLFLNASLGLSYPLIDLSHIPDNRVLVYWGAANLALHITYATWWFWSGRKAYSKD